MYSNFFFFLFVSKEKKNQRVAIIMDTDVLREFTIKPQGYVEPILSFGMQECLYLHNRIFKPNTMIGGNSFISNHYLPYPDRTSIRRFLFWVINQSSDFLSVLESWIIKQENKQGIAYKKSAAAKQEYEDDRIIDDHGEDEDEDGNLFSKITDDFWSETTVSAAAAAAASSAASASASASTSALIGLNGIKWKINFILCQMDRTTPYYTFHLKEKELLHIMMTVLVQNMEILPLDNTIYHNPNDMPITELQLKNAYEEMRSGGGLHVLWRKLKLHHPLDIFASLFVPNEIRQDVKLFFLMMVYKAVEHYNAAGIADGSYPSFLDLKNTMFSMLDQIQIVLPARIHILLPHNNLAFCHIFKTQVYDWCCEMCPLYNEHMDSQEPQVSIRRQLQTSGHMYIDHLPFQEIFVV